MGPILKVASYVDKSPSTRAITTKPHARAQSIQSLHCALPLNPPVLESLLGS